MVELNNDKSQLEEHSQPQEVERERKTNKMGRQMPLNVNNSNNRSERDRRPDPPGDHGSRSREDDDDRQQLLLNVVNRPEDDRQPDPPDDHGSRGRSRGGDDDRRQIPLNVNNNSRRQSIIGTVPNLASRGDKQQPRRNDDGVIRFGFQNTNTIKHPRSNYIPQEIQVVEDLGIDVCGFVETNRPWTTQNKEIYDINMRNIFGNQTSTIYASIPAVHDTKFQPGGVLQTINGCAVGRIAASGVDKYGRFAWQTLNGSRDEGIVVITAYRVCQTRVGDCGPNTAFMQQYTAMVKDGRSKPYPRQQILTDLLKLIREKREAGFRPILMLDANGSTFSDEKFRTFQQEALLEDPYYSKFHEMPATYMRGRKRLDYILMDAGLLSAVRELGYLGTHQAVPDSDHSMAWVDFDERELFRGKINRPPTFIHRQFTLHQEDKVSKFMSELRERIMEHNIPGKVAALLAVFHQNGANDDLIQKYNALDKEYTDIIRAALKKTGRRRYGYTRSPQLTEAGRNVNLHKGILDCRRRKAPLSEGVLNLAHDLGYDLSKVDETPIPVLRRNAAAAREKLKEVQRSADENRCAWLQERAELPAPAEVGEKDTDSLEKLRKDIWKTRMKAMIATAEAASTNRKLTAITKGYNQGFDRVEIPQDEWIYDETKNELYHYQNGVFETHAVIQRTANTHIQRRVFYAHHSLKVPAKESIPVHVERGTNGTLMIREVISTEPFQWKQIVSQSEIERSIIQRNKRHLQQVHCEGGPSTRQPLQQLSDLDSADMDALLNGEYIFRDPATTEPLEISNTLATWIGQMQLTQKERAMEPTVGSIPPQALQKAFQMAKEKTASHGDLHYTVWKAMVADDKFAAWISVMISIPFVFGFAPERWRSMTDVMLEKKKGNRQINQLRIIGLLEADFNTALKYFAREFSKKMEDTGELSPEQWGSRNNRNSIDAAMIKLLTFETARAKRSTIGMICYDLTACFDRMNPAMSNLDLRKRNFDQGILQARAEALRYMKRHVRTGLGVSEEYYNEAEGDIPLLGEIQGKADNPALYTASSSAMLHTHAALAPGLELRSCTGERSMKRHNVSYVDDNDGQVSATFDSERPLDEVIGKMKLSATIWNEVVGFTGQSIAYHKTAWQVLAWRTVRGELKPVMAVDDIIMLTDHNGAASVIKFLPPDQPNKGLGYHLCPDGNQAKEFEVVMDKLQRFSASASSAFLTPREAKQLLYQRLMPMLDYVLHLSSFDDKQCHQMDKKIRANFFPKMGFSRTSADEVMRGPMEQGGMEFPAIKSRQTEVQTEYVIKQLRNGEDVEEGFMTTLDNLQMQSGLMNPLFEDSTNLTYMDIGLIVSLRERLNGIDASIWIEDAWKPELQREGDKCLMEEFVRMKYTKTRLRHLNAVRLRMRVITLADLVDVSGKVIDPHILEGSYVATSPLEWHHTADPPQKWKDEFRKCVRETFCKRMGRRFSYKKQLKLDEPLGKWLPVPRHTLFQCYRGKEAIYKRIFHDDGTTTIQRMTARTELTGYYQYDEDVEVLPLETYPILMREVGEEVWTQRIFDMVPKEETIRKPPGLISEDTHQQGSTREPSKTVSDASVLLADQIAGAAWIIPTNTEEYVKACFLMTNMGSMNSYRGELEGAYRALYHIDYLGMDPAELLTQWFDNASGVWKLNQPLKTGRDKIQPEADLIMAYHHLKSKLQCGVRSRHVRGHQDTKRKKKPLQETEDDSDCDSLATTESTKLKEIDETKLSDEAKLNIECDKLAGEVTKYAKDHPHDLPPSDDILQMPYPGSKAVLKIGNKWITARTKKHLYNASQGPKLRAYIQRRHDLTDAQYNSVNWHTIGAVRRRSDLSKQRFTCKLMHGLLPVNHVRQHVTSISQCPGCPCGDETIAHLFKCPNSRMVSKRDEIIAALRKKGLRKLSRKILCTVAEIMEQYSEGEEIKPTTKHPDVLRAVHAQGELGSWEDFFRGYLVKEWKAAFHATHNSDADMQFDQFQQMMWFDIAWPQWMERNQVAKGSGSNADQLENEMLTRQLVWYHKHKDELLPIHQRDMARLQLHQVVRLRPATRRSWLNHLKVATKAWDRQKHTVSRDQRTMLDYITNPGPPRPPPRPRNIAREARDHADRVVLRLEPNQQRIDNVLDPVE